MGGFHDTPPPLLNECYSGCQIQEAERFTQDIQDGLGPDSLLATLLTAIMGIVNKRLSVYHENAQSPDSTTMGRGQLRAQVADAARWALTRARGIFTSRIRDIERRTARDVAGGSRHVRGPI